MAGRLRGELGQPRAKIPAARLELLCPGLGLPVNGVLTPSVTASSHRECVLPARHVLLKLRQGTPQLSLQPIPHSPIESPDPDNPTGGRRAERAPTALLVDACLAPAASELSGVDPLQIGVG